MRRIQHVRQMRLLFRGACNAHVSLTLNINAYPIQYRDPPQVIPPGIRCVF